MAGVKPFGPDTTLEIKTKSIEQTLLPLVQQVRLNKSLQVIIRLVIPLSDNATLIKLFLIIIVGSAVLFTAGYVNVFGW